MRTFFSAKKITLYVSFKKLQETLSACWTHPKMLPSYLYVKFPFSPTKKLVSYLSRPINLGRSCKMGIFRADCVLLNSLSNPSMLWYPGGAISYFTQHHESRKRYEMCYSCLEGATHFSHSSVNLYIDLLYTGCLKKMHTPY